MVGGLIGAIVGGLGWLVGSVIVGAWLDIGINFATVNLVISICVGFNTWIAGLFIGGIIKKHLNLWPKTSLLLLNLTITF